jgi:hypothetical protein
VSAALTPASGRPRIAVSELGPGVVSGEMRRLKSGDLAMPTYLKRLAVLRCAEPPRWLVRAVASRCAVRRTRIANTGVNVERTIEALEQIRVVLEQPFAVDETKAIGARRTRVRSVATG